MKGDFGMDDFGVVPLKTCAAEWGRSRHSKVASIAPEQPFLDQHCDPQASLQHERPANLFHKL
jgi:hypothetical protein